MKAHTSYAVIAIFAMVGIVSLVPASASIHGASNQFDLPPACPDCVGNTAEQILEAAQQDIPITVWTDSAVYDHNSVIVVDGKVANLKSGIPVTLIVSSPSNNIVKIAQVNVDDQKTFSARLNTSGDLWKYDGTYTIRVQYGGEEVNNRVLVELTGGAVIVQPTPQVTCGASEFAIAEQCVPFSITGGAVTGADVDTKSKSITIRINADNDGEITINPSTEVISGIHIVLIDGEEANDVIIDGNSVTVIFPAGAEMIEIFGTSVIPEFGTVAVLVLAVAIVSIIAVTTRSRVGIMPRY